MRHCLQFRAAGVIQHVGRDGSLVVPAHLRHVMPGVAQHFNRLAAHGKEDIYRRVLSWMPRSDQSLMFFEIEAATHGVRQQRQREEYGGQQQERAVDPEPVVLDHQPDLAVQQQRGAGDTKDGDEHGPALDVAVFLLVQRRHGEALAVTCHRCGRHSRTGPRQL